MLVSVGSLVLCLEAVLVRGLFFDKVYSIAAAASCLSIRIQPLRFLWMDLVLTVWVLYFFLCCHRLSLKVFGQVGRQLSSLYH